MQVNSTTNTAATVAVPTVVGAAAGVGVGAYKAGKVALKDNKDVTLKQNLENAKKALEKHTATKDEFIASGLNKAAEGDSEGAKKLAGWLGEQAEVNKNFKVDEANAVLKQAEGKVADQKTNVEAAEKAVKELAADATEEAKNTANKALNSAKETLGEFETKAKEAKEAAQKVAKDASEAFQKDHKEAFDGLKAKGDEIAETFTKSDAYKKLTEGVKEAKKLVNGQKLKWAGILAVAGAAIGGAVAFAKNKKAAQTPEQK